MSNLKITMLTGVICLTAFFGYMYLRDEPAGYCEEQKRVIPDDELLANYLDAKIKSGQLKLGPLETTGRDYLANHPECCHIKKHNAKGIFGACLYDRFGSCVDGIFQYALGDTAMEVSLVYEMTDEDKKHYGVPSDSEDTHYEQILFATSCGKVLENTGMSRPKSPTNSNRNN